MKDFLLPGDVATIFVITTEKYVALCNSTQILTVVRTRLSQCIRGKHNKKS
jgi:hypothetical protein